MSQVKAREPALIHVVFSALKHRVLHLTLYLVQAGRTGQTRMHNCIRQAYFWPHMAAKIATTVLKYIPCVKNGVRQINKANPMCLFPTTTSLDTAALDILGPLRKSKYVYLFIRVITDWFSKLTGLFLMPMNAGVHPINKNGKR